MILRNCDMKTFSKRCKGKKLACYGIGKEFQRMVGGYSGYEWVNQIEYLADGNNSREGEWIQINNRSYAISSLESLRQNLSSDDVVMITCMSYGEVVDVLQAIPEFHDTECYLFHFMFSLCEDDTIPIRTTETPLIPKQIHYCWFGGKEKPDFYKRCMESWYHHCPEYEIKEWNEENCDINETLFTKQAYESGKYGFVPDYFRLKIIYKNGGIYLDTDVEMLKNMDDLLYNQAFCGLEFPGEANLGLGFGAQKGHPVIQKLIERYYHMRFVNPDGSFNEIGSPVFQSEDLRELGMTNENIIQTVNSMTIYPSSVLSPQNVYTGITSIAANTYLWHHFDGSWVTGERLERKIKRQKDSAILQQIIKENEEYE